MLDIIVLLILQICAFVLLIVDKEISVFNIVLMAYLLISLLLVYIDNKVGVFLSIGYALLIIVAVILDFSILALIDLVLAISLAYSAYKYLKNN